MRIATWNVERLKHRKRLDNIQAACQATNADILVLTETDQTIHTDYPYQIHTEHPHDSKWSIYKDSERRVSILTRYPCLRQHDTFDAETAVCAELDTDIGPLLVYGTIIGIYGNRRQSFLEDLKKQIEDFKRLSAIGSLCICGDFNCSFADNYYFTTEGRKLMTEAFYQCSLCLLTHSVKQGIDHIVFPYRHLAANRAQIFEWNTDKSLSDHKGVGVDISKKKLFSDRRWTDPPYTIVTGHQEVPIEDRLRALDFWLEKKIMSPEEYQKRKNELLKHHDDDSD